MTARSRGFPPIAAPDARLLILGSLPGQTSLARRQYYAQPQNAFWRIMGHLFGAGLDVPYERRAEILVSNRIALWDVCKAASRPGSLDSSIDPRSVVPNDFRRFFREHPQVGLVCVNGATASRLYARLVHPKLAAEARAVAVQTLPSTSPAHASMRFDEKLARWRVVADFLERA